jgi:hypothetical protein
MLGERTPKPLPTPNSPPEMLLTGDDVSSCFWQTAMHGFTALGRTCRRQE